LLLGGIAAAADYFDETKATTLFAFDDVSIPTRRICAWRCDSRAFIRQSGGEARCTGHGGCAWRAVLWLHHQGWTANTACGMWPLMINDESKVAPSSRWRAAYAESADGMTWTKPNLGLVSSRQQEKQPRRCRRAAWGFVNLKVIKDEADPDPARRYKMTTHVYFGTTHAWAHCCPL
jgi:hypothetical protein